MATKEAEVYQLTILTFKHHLILSCPARFSATDGSGNLATDDHDDHASYSQLRRKDVLPSDPVLPCKVVAAATDDHDHATRWW